MYLLVIILFIAFCISYLCGLFEPYNPTAIPQSTDENILHIEHLTQHISKTKNYRKIPENFTSYNKKLVASRQGSSVLVDYEFPLMNRKSSVFKSVLHPEPVSQSVNLYGIKKQFIKKVNADTITINSQYTGEELYSAFSIGCWFFLNTSNWGVDYPRLVHHNANFSFPIAQHIHQSLVSIHSDTYLCRVQAALNFVQFIPYGKPQFDTEEWYYHEVAMPAESFVMGYSDCDSKSIFLATILIHLIPKDNIVLIDCLVRSKNEKINGAHMMVAVSDLDLVGENITFNNKNYILLETTAPCVMGKSEWEDLQVKGIISL